MFLKTCKLNFKFIKKIVWRIIETQPLSATWASPAVKQAHCWNLVGSDLIGSEKTSNVEILASDWSIMLCKCDFSLARSQISSLLEFG